ncbi:hypothetical protein VTK26DRAFT_5188 [Humicola hyalothermophila]
MGDLIVERELDEVHLARHDPLFVDLAAWEGNMEPLTHAAEPVANDQLGNDPVLAARPPSVRGRSPGLEQSVAQLLASHAPAPAQGRAPRAAVDDDVDVFEFINEDMVEPGEARPRRRSGGRRRRNRDDDEDREWRPRSSGVRKRPLASSPARPDDRTKRPRTAGPSSARAAPTAGPGVEAPLAGSAPRVAAAPLAPWPPQGAVAAARPRPASLAAASSSAAGPSRSVARPVPGQPGSADQPAAAPASNADQPAKKRRGPRKKAEPKVDENGQPIRNHKTNSGWTYRPDRVLESTRTGVQMTCEEAWKHFGHLRYRAGGSRGGGEYEDPTGDRWFYVGAKQDHSGRERRPRQGRQGAAANAGSASGAPAAPARRARGRPRRQAANPAPVAPAGTNGPDAPVLGGAAAPARPAPLTMPFPARNPTGLALPAGLPQSIAQMGSVGSGVAPGTANAGRPSVGALRTNNVSAGASHPHNIGQGASRTNNTPGGTQ